MQIRDWMKSVEDDLRRLDDKWQKTADDIKALIRAEIGDLKQEQIADLKHRVVEGYKTLEKFEERVKAIEVEQNKWQTSAGLINWLIRTAFALLGLLAGIFGWETWHR